MTTTPENIEKLLYLLADKTLSFGCRIHTRKKHSAKPSLFNPGGKEMELDMEQIVYDCKDHPTSFSKIIRSVEGGFYSDLEIVKILGHPVRIGDVLEEMRAELNIPTMENLLNKWGECGFAKSLQEIVEESGYQEVWVDCKGITGIKNSVGGGKRKSQQLKSPSARSLFEFLFFINQKTLCWFTR